MSLKKKLYLLMIVINGFLFTNCDANYRYSLIIDLPVDQYYKIKILADPDWIITNINRTQIESNIYTGFNKILEDHKIGSGIKKIDFSKMLDEENPFMEIIGQTDNKSIIINKNQIEIYKRNDLEIIFYIKLK